MVNINLLPPEIKLTIKQAKTSANIFSICLVIILFTALVIFSLYELKNMYLSVALESSQKDLKNATDSLESFNNLATKAIFINDRASIASEIEKNRASWSIIIQDLINSSPSDVQFTTLTVDLTKKPNFVLQGNTTSEREAIKFRDKLESSQYFKDVAFKSSSTVGGVQIDKTKPQTLSFTLEFNLEKLSPSSTAISGGNK